MEQVRSVKFYQKKLITEKPKIWNISLLIPKKKKKKKQIRIYKKDGRNTGTRISSRQKFLHDRTNNSLLFPTENEQTLDGNNLKQDTAHPLLLFLTHTETQFELTKHFTRDPVTPSNVTLLFISIQG